MPRSVSPVGGTRPNKPVSPIRATALAFPIYWQRGHREFSAISAVTQKGDNLHRNVRLKTAKTASKGHLARDYRCSGGFGRLPG